MDRLILFRRTVVLALTSALVLGVGVAPAGAAKLREKPLDRGKVIQRAKRWTNARVPYSQSGYRAGYRRDCSGFVSYAWDVPENLVTWRIPYVTKRISQRQLRPGDVLLNYKSPPGARHVVIFERWANRSHTKYVGLESTGQDGVDRAVRRVLPYPYRVAKDRYKPYRYVGMAGYYRKVPKRLRLPVRGYDGRVTTPGMIAARERAAARRQAARQAEISRRAQRASEATRLAHEREAAEQARADARARLASRLVRSAALVGGGVASMLMQPVVDDSLSRAQQRPPDGR